MTPYFGNDEIKRFVEYQPRKGKSQTWESSLHGLKISWLILAIILPTSRNYSKFGLFYIKNDYHSSGDVSRVKAGNTT